MMSSFHSADVRKTNNVGKTYPLEYTYVQWNFLVHIDALELHYHGTRLETSSVVGVVTRRLAQDNFKMLRKKHLLKKKFWI
jgi:hypothetical protein